MTSTRKEAAQQPPKRTLRPHEAESIRQKIRTNESMIKATEGTFGDSVYSPVIPPDVSIGKERLALETKQLKKVLDDQTPRGVSDPIKRDKILRERKDLQDKFLPYLETWRDLDARPGSPEYSEALRKAKARPQVNHLIERWRELGKMLDPEDPTINDLDRLRAAR